MAYIFKTWTKFVSYLNCFSLRGWSSHFKGFSLANCRKSTKRWTKYHLLLIYSNKNTLFGNCQNTVFWWFWSPIQENWTKHSILICTDYSATHLFKSRMCVLKNQGGNTFWKNNAVSFVSTFLIGRAIRHFWFFLGY